jgi:Methane oxygenase PmoA
MTDDLILQVSAGDHDRSECPVWLPCPAGVPPTGPLVLVDRESGDHWPVQRLGDELVFVVSELPRGTARELKLVGGDAPGPAARLTQQGDAFEIAIGDRPFTTYHFGSQAVRPYFFPLLGPDGVPMTRSFPMLAGISGESTDHPHHRSLYVGFGEVNGVDCWSEPPHSNTGRIVHQAWDGVADGPVAAVLRERLRWVDGQGNALLDEQRRIVVYASATVRLLDLELRLAPAHAAVLFGDTKEGGPLAVRVNSAIEGKRGGTIENAYGGRREAECWGKRAPWVDYSGSVDGAAVGLALFDHPTSFRHPTYWHVRDYGLFAANPFGLSTFANDPSQRGDVVLAPGQSLTFRYRVCLHRGDAATGNVADHYQDFANPPSVEVITG